jgi:Ras GTPase-activating-like protein IQGAP2/3
MDRSNSISSNASSSSRSGSISGPFAYQTRLLERTSSRGGTSSLSRTNSQISNAVNGSPTGQATTRRWKPSHRVGNSVDAVRGKWEERARAESLIDPRIQSNYHLESIPGHETSLNVNQPVELNTMSPSSEHGANVTHTRPTEITNEYGTPSRQKRHTMPAPIIAIPLSPNTTGVSVHSTGSPSSPFPTPTPNRIHLPTSTSFQSTSTSSFQRLSGSSSPGFTSDMPLRSPTARFRHSNSLENVTSTITGPSKPAEAISFNISRTSYTTTTPAAAYQPQPTLLTSAKSSNPTSHDSRDGLTSKSRLSRTMSTSNEQLSGQWHTPAKSSPSQAPPSVMSPTPYKSSYMAGKYGSIGSKLGRHLPRIASGDGEDTWEEAKKKEDREHRRKKRERQSREWDLPPAPPVKDPPRMREMVHSGATTADDVAGIPGRIRLSRDTVPTSPTSPLPSVPLSRGLWADTHRQHLLAYEYLCHVGEAQQWIEGCLGEELGFGVVEMEEGLRNGVVLAKLVRAFQGQRVVRKIYEARK